MYEIAAPQFLQTVVYNAYSKQNKHYQN